MSNIELDLDRMQAELLLNKLDEGGIIIYAEAPGWLKHVNPLLSVDQMAELTKIVRGYLQHLVEDINQQLGGRDGKG